MPLALKFRILNVFAESPLGGNPLCVFEDGSGLDDATMQRLALQFNLSETTFLLPADDVRAVRRVRIFTPMFELAFAGHPTLGTAHVVRSMLGGDVLCLQMQAGLIRVLAAGDRWTLEAAPPRWHRSGVERAHIAGMLGLARSDVLEGDLWVDTGSEQWVIPLASPDAVERCRPGAADLARLAVGTKRRGIAYVWSRAADARVVRARFFLERHGGVVEDPGTGSACANLGGWWVATGAALPLDCVVQQGDHLWRPCRLGLRVEADRRILVTGRVIELGRGEIRLPDPEHR